MSAPKPSDPVDRKCVNVSAKRNLQYWATFFRVRPAAIVNAVRMVGVEVEDVARYLGR